MKCGVFLPAFAPAMTTIDVIVSVETKQNNNINQRTGKSQSNSTIVRLNLRVMAAAHSHSSNCVRFYISTKRRRKTAQCFRAHFIRCIINSFVVSQMQTKCPTGAMAKGKKVCVCSCIHENS